MDTLSVTLPGAAGGETITVSVADLPESIRFLLLQHGLQQKLADPVSSASTKGWSQAEAHEKCMEALANLKAGTWAKRGGGPRATTFEAWLAKQADKEATALTKKGGKYEGKDPAKVARALVAQNHDWVSRMRKKWDDLKAEQEAKKLAEGLELDLDDED